jgi:3'(2'), 5'-bisphosphate nucleotidase
VVTDADHAAEAIIVAGLRTIAPDAAVVAEEEMAAGHVPKMDGTPFWLVDPLDGTKEFVAKNGEFSVMIGLAIDGHAQLGVVFQPSADKLYRGVVDQGASLEHAGMQRPVFVSAIADTSALSLIVSRSHRPKSTTELTNRLGIMRESISGSVGLKIGLIAEQRADLYVHVSDKSSAWDTCGPEAILVAAGGRFTDLAGDPFVYGKPDLRTRRGILACNAAAFDAVLPVVRELAIRDGFLKP